MSSSRPAADARNNPHPLLLYDQAFDHRAWHGTTLWGSLRLTRDPEATFPTLTERLAAPAGRCRQRRVASGPRVAQE